MVDHGRNAHSPIRANACAGCATVHYSEQTVLSNISDYTSKKAGLVSQHSTGALNDGQFAEAQERLIATTVFTPDGLDKPPVALTQAKPRFFFGDALGKTDVVVQFIVAPNGSVLDISVLNGSYSRFADACVEGLRLARYTPGYKDGRAVATRMQLRARIQDLYAGPYTQDSPDQRFFAAGGFVPQYREQHWH